MVPPAPAIDTSAQTAGTIRAELADRGFSVLRGALDAARLCRLRAHILRVMHEHGWVRADDDPAPTARAPREGGDGWWRGYAAIQRLEPLHQLGHDQKLTALLGAVFGGPVLPHNRRIVGVTLPGYGTPPHQDFVSVQGSTDTITAWIPLDARSGDSAALRLMPAGDTPCLLPLEWVDGITAQVRPDPPGTSWYQPGAAVGDAVLYHGFTVHELSPNLDSHTRLACELRFQPLADPVCGASLQPHHYPRVPGWPELTRGWQSTSWIGIPPGANLAPFHLPRRIERWHAELTPGPSRLLRPRMAVLPE